MNSERTDNTACEPYQKLIAWYPTESLSEDERRQVDAHAAVCPGCSRLLDFASEFKTMLAADFSPHPVADMLVDYVEERAAMETGARAAVDLHLESCAECRAEVQMLEAVDRSASDQDQRSAVPHRADPRATDVPGVIRRVWEFLSGGLLRPAAAAVYLIVAVAAIGLLVSRMDRAGTKITGHAGGVLDGVVVLPDESSAVRGGSSGPRGKTLGSGVPRFLLLELTGLDAPPNPDDVYTVRVTGQGAPDRSLTMSVTGSAFIDNYTLCLSLEPGSLEPGSYVVDVAGPDGNSVFRSSLVVE